MLILQQVNVPLVIRGPKVPKGKTVDFVTSHLDIAPTVVNWAGAKGPGDFDGAVIPADGTPETQEPWEHVQVEHWGLVSDKDNVPKDLIGKVNTYKAIRVIGPQYNLYYAVWCDGDHEVYNMAVRTLHFQTLPALANNSKTDPYQMNNLYNSSQTVLGASMKKLEDRLDALTLVLKSCAGDSCRQPWEQLHKDGKVKTLVDALKPEFDDFYKNQNKVKFAQCAKSYFVQNELPIKYHTYGKDGSIQDRDVDWWMYAG